MINHFREAVPRLGYREALGTSFLEDSVETRDERYTVENKHAE
jgi:hypothetical protein